MPKNDYHGFENTGDEPVFMIWGYAGAASLDEAGYYRLVTSPVNSLASPGMRRDIEFKSGGETVRGWLYIPDAEAARARSSSWPGDGAM